MELQEEHIKNLRVITDRTKMLEFLPKNGIVAELGVDEGNFSEKILLVNKPSKLFLIDSWNSERYGINKMHLVEERFKDAIKSGIVNIIRGFSEIELTKFENNYFDWVYIDTAHSYDQTKKELEITRLKVKQGGIIAGHDYTKGNIVNGYKYGVIEAVNEFCLVYDWEMIFLTIESNSAFSFALKKIIH